MKITVMLLIAAIMQVSAASFAQKVTLHKRNVTLAQVFDEVRKQTGYDVLYGSDKLKGDTKINAAFNQTPIDEVMNKCLEGKALTFDIEDKTIVIKEKTPSFLDRVVAAFAAIDIRGKVVGEQSEVLIGATVKVKGTDKGVSTDKNGEFYLQNVDEAAVVVVSYLGYVSKEVKAEKEMGVIKLELQNNDLQEVTINKGYYSTKKELNTGSVSSIKAVDIAKQPVNNLMSALSGRIPGVYVSESSGVPGSSINVSLRGQNSILNGNDPLYVIDGVPFSSKSLYDGINVEQSAVGLMSPLFSIRPADIESVEILKDADATAIYGSRGANGVILITTKKGKSGSTEVNVNINRGMSSISNKMELMDTEQYLEMRRKAFTNDGVLPTTTDYDLNGSWDTTRYTDWQNVLIGGTAQSTDAQVSLSGGNTYTQFLLRTGYRRETTVFPGDYKTLKGSGHLNINHKSNNEKLSANFSLSYVYDNINLPITDFTSNILLAPNAPALYSNDGSLNWQNSTWTNPLRTIFQSNNTTNSNLNALLNLNYEIAKRLKLTSNFGYNQMGMETVNLLPLLGSNPAAQQDPSQRWNSFGNNTSRNWIIEPGISYNINIAKSKFEALIGVTFQQRNSFGIGQRASGFSSDAIMRNITAATSVITTGVTGGLYRYNAFYGRINWNYDSKYLINVTGRRDGSSRFGPGKRFGNFGALGAAWIFSNEAFVNKSIPFLSFGKLRGSIGITGNDQLEEYKYLSTYTPFAEGYQGGSTLMPSSLNNPTYSWETVKKSEAALELGFFKDRLTISTAWYLHRTENQLVEYQLPNITGFPSVRANLPAVIQNSGIEFDFSGTNIKKGNFSWITTLNFTFPRNKLLSFPNISASTYATQYAVGSPLTVRYRYNYTGIDLNTNTYTFEDVNKDNQITNAFDRRFVFIGQRSFGGIGNTLKFKCFQLDLFVQYVKQTGYEWLPSAAPGRYLGVGSNQLASTLSDVDQQKKQKLTVSSTSIAGRAYSNFLNSNGPVKDVSFARLKNISLSCTLPDKWTKKMKINSTTLYVLGQNLLTITPYDGLDPETVQSTATAIRLPVLKTVTFGLNLFFNKEIIIKMKKNTIFMFLLLPLLINSSCEKFVDVGKPDILLPAEKTFEVDATATSAMIGIYAQMQASARVSLIQLPYVLSVWTGIAGDELTNFSTVYSEIAKNTLLSETSQTNALWNQVFSLIYQANSVFEGCNTSNKLSPSVKEQLMAEARFVRAFWNFYLVNLYGSIPIISDTNYKENAVKSRSSADEVYKLIVSDLQYAKMHINHNYVALNSTSASSDRIRPNKATVSALLAKVYLFQKKYALAEEEVGTLIGNTTDYKLESIEKVFLTTGKEAIWQLSLPTPTNNRNTWEAYGYVLTSKPTASITNSTAISTALLNRFLKTDSRFQNWISKVTDKSVTPNIDYYYPSKYKVINSTSITERSTVYRMGEMILIRSESRAQQNNLLGAIEDLDLVRKRANISLLALQNPGISKASLLDSIAVERQRELFTEWGNRWLDLKRSGKIDEIMSEIAQSKGTIWDSRQQLWPVPFIETQRNPNLIPNNPGYN